MDPRSWLSLSLRQPSLPPPPPPPPSRPSSPPPPPPPPFTFQYIPLFGIPPPQNTHIFFPELLEQQDQQQQQQQEPELVMPPRRQGRERQQQIQYKNGKSDTIPPPFPWATSKRAVVYTLDHLLSQGLTKIKGTLQCKGCDVQSEIEFDLVEKFEKVTSYIASYEKEMHDRAPIPWTNPVFPNCESCGQVNGLKPVISNKKRDINWLFLLLGEMIGCCKIDHLRYFCKHSQIHRTASKDRLLYKTYLGLCKQLQPNGPFSI